MSFPRHRLGFRVFSKKRARSREPPPFSSSSFVFPPERIPYVGNREKKKERETETEMKGRTGEWKKREHPMGFCTIAFPVVASRELSRQYILGRLREDTAEVGDIRPHTASMRGFTMKFDWHLTLVRFIMAGVSYYQIIEASNIIRSARRLVYAASRNLLRRTNTYCESRTMDDKTMRRNGSHDS